MLIGRFLNCITCYKILMNITVFILLVLIYWHEIEIITQIKRECIIFNLYKILYKQI